MYKNVDRSQGADEGNIIIGLFDGGWWWMIPFKDGDTSVGMVFEKSLHQGQPRLLVAAADGGGARAPAAPQALSRDATRFLDVGAQGNWTYRSTHFYGERLLMVGDSAAFVDPLFSTGVLFAINGAKFAAAHIDAALDRRQLRRRALRAVSGRVHRAAWTSSRTWCTSSTRRTCARCCSRSAQNPTVCAVITSLLAGDVYKPAMWHSVVKKQGFSPGGAPR